MYKSILKTILGLNRYIKYQQLYIMMINYYNDFKLYKSYSLVFGITSLKNKEAAIILDYHSIEKGFLYQNMKPYFAKNRIQRLNKLLNEQAFVQNFEQSQIDVAYKVMCKYYELHKEKGYDIEDYFSESQYSVYKKILNNQYSNNFHGIVSYTNEDFFKQNDADFEHFARSRRSVRDFTGEKVDKLQISKAIELASTAPSVCNRQANKVYLINDKIQIDKLLRIQGGMTGYTENIHQLLILTNDRSFYYTIGERNQFYIDGGIFLMNLLYSLHFYKIAACPANWGKTMKADAKVLELINIPESEKIICMVPIGVAKDDFRVCLSKRRSEEEILIEL